MRYYVVSLTTGIWWYHNESLAALEGAIDQRKPPTSTTSPLARVLVIASTSMRRIFPLKPMSMPFRTPRGWAVKKKLPLTTFTEVPMPEGVRMDRDMRASTW